MNLHDSLRVLKHQAAWTAPMRRELYRRARLAARKSVLDVGCGDGAITREMAEICRGRVLGVDIDERMIAAARKETDKASYRTGDASALDFPRSQFDLVSCHWLLLWLPDPAVALREFRRVLKPGGTLLVACEPDFGGRMVFPEAAGLNDEVISCLQSHGADPMMGRKLPSLLNNAGFKASCGIYPGVWDSNTAADLLDSEIGSLQTLLRGRVDDKKLTAAFSALRKSRGRGDLLIFTPVFWAIAERRN